MAIRNKRDGFSLIEVAIGLLIIGLMIGPMMARYTAWISLQQYQVTKDNGGIIRDALSKYALNYSCYPVPAPPGVNSSTAAAGVEGVARVTCTPLTAGQLAAIPVCGGSDAVVCQEASAAGVAGAGPVLVGDLPYNTLGLPKQYILDGYGRKFTYAVSANLVLDAAATTFDETKGAVKIADLFGKGPTIGAGPPGNGPPILDAHYAIVSHGKDGSGAFTLDNGGVPVGVCAGGGKDVENCLYNDGTFDNGFAPYNDATGLLRYDRQESRVAGAAHFDDYVYYTEKLSTDIWAKQPSTADIVSNNGTGNVLVKTPATSGPINPQAKLDIRGDLTADQLWTNIICDTSGNTFVAPNTYTNKPCAGGATPAGGFSPLAFAKTPPVEQQLPGDNVIHCNTYTTSVGTTVGAPMNGIAAADEQCADISDLSPQVKIQPADPVYNYAGCAAGTYPDGTDGAGNLHCRIPP